MRTRVKPTIFEVNTNEDHHSVYFGQSYPPDDKFNEMTAEPCAPLSFGEEPNDGSCVVVQFFDIVESLIAKHIENDNTKDGVVRYALKLQDARALCCGLIHALGQSGDRIALRLAECLNEMDMDK